MIPEVLLRTIGACVLVAGCAHPSAREVPAERGPDVATVTPEPMPPVPTPKPAASEAPPADFARDVLPILEARCQPCHFPGGRMYDRIPFDRAETIHQLGPKLFTRIKTEDERAVIRRFLAQGP
jgi:hypothetical protein